MKRFTLILALLLAITSFSFAQKSPADRITPALKAELEKRTGADEQFRIIITMAEQYDQAKMSKQIENMKGDQRRDYVVNEMMRFTKASQADLLMTLQDAKKAGMVKDLNPFWIFNGVSCITTREMIYALAERPDIARISSDEIRNMLPENNLNKGKAPKPIVTRDGYRPTLDTAWNVKQVHADKVWKYSYNDHNIKGKDIVVAVIDTGLDYYHPDIINHIWQPLDNSPVDTLGTFTVGNVTYKKPGYNFADKVKDPMDDNGHGTHCAGTVAGYGTSGIQTGMAPEATIMALKVLGAGGSGSQDGILSAMEFAMENGAHVVSMSLGGHESFLGDLFNVDSNGPYREAFNTMMNSVVAVVAAGNEGEQYSLAHAVSGTHYDVPKNVGSPGNCPGPWTHPDQTLTGGNSGVITIGASNRNDRKSTFSSFGPVSWKDSDLSDYFKNDYDDYWWESDGDPMGLIKPDVLAPGSDITSLYYKYENPNFANDANYHSVPDTIYMAECGTSMATPGCAGIVALMLQAANEKEITLTPRKVDSILELTALPVDFRTTKNNTTGAGRADAKAAVNAILTTAAKPGTFAVINVDANGVVQNGGCVHLSWGESSSASGYCIYRDNEQVGTTTELTYKDEDPGVGMHTYFVCAYDSNGYQSIRSNAVVCKVNPYASANDLNITWSESSNTTPTVGTATLGWTPNVGSDLGNTAKRSLNYVDLNQTYTAYTGQSLSVARWGMCFTPEDLRPYLGMQIDSVQLYIYKNGLTSTVFDNVHLYIYRGTQYGNSTGDKDVAPKVYDRTFHVREISQFTKITLKLDDDLYIAGEDKGPYVIDDISQDLWITFADIVNTDLIGLVQEYAMAVGEYDGPSSNCFYMGSSSAIVPKNDVVWSHIPDFGDAYNYGITATAYLSRAKKYEGSYKVEFDNSLVSAHPTELQASQSGGTYNDANRTLASGENKYYVTAKATEMTKNSSDQWVTTGNEFTTCPQEAKIVKVDGTYSETSSKVDIDQTKVYLVQSDGVITSDGITCTDPTRLIIEDGGQVVSTSPNVKATAKKEITHYTNSAGKDHWHAVASPITDPIEPSVGNGFVPNNSNENYDLYYFDQNPPLENGDYSLEWRNSQNTENFKINNKIGYFYANSANSTLRFEGTLARDGYVSATNLDYNSNARDRVRGFNLIGNPYPYKTYINRRCYMVEECEGESKFIEHPINTAIQPGQAIMVKASKTGETVEFSKTVFPESTNNCITVSVMKANLRGDAFLDRARVSFTEGDQLTKYNLNEQSTKLYIPMDGEQFAVAYAADNKEMPVSFQPASNGTYTLSVENNNDELGYLHLIDNMTGTDTDLLQTPSYTFEASTDNYASRFRLLFGPANDNADADDIFAYVGNQEIRLLVQPQDGAILQVVDVTGRVMTNENVSGDVSGNVSTANMAPGVYVLRLIEGEGVRTQKVVIE